MTESFVTQCPHCSTRFKVTAPQLRAARGAVRCGSCLQVFNAAQQLQEQGLYTPEPVHPTPALKPEPEPAAEPSAPVTRPSDDTLWIHDDLDLDLDHLDLDQELARLEQQQSEESAASKQPAAQPLLPEIEPSEYEKADESWAEELLKAEQAASERAAQQARASDDDKELRRPQGPIQPLTLIERKEPRLTADEALYDTTAEPEDEPEEDFGINASRHDDSDDGQLLQGFSATHKGGKLNPQLDDKRLIELDDEPLSLDYEPVKKGGGMRVLWTLLALIAALALAGQYVAYHFEELARQDRYRPWFEQACPIVGCTLPSKVDISQIKSSNLVVRSHPDFSGALVVDAIIYNRAPFSQPFPLLEMRFADINGKLLASRRFKPSEYLAGELAGQTEMPSQIPIHIALDILDPGTKAVNYSLSFHSPE